MKSWMTLTVSAVFAVACAEGAPPGEGPFQATTVSGAVEYGEGPGTIEYDLPAGVTALGSDNGVIMVGTEDGVSALYGIELVEVVVFAKAGEPLTTGAVYSMAPRAQGLLVAAENGLFHTFEGALLYSPLSDAVKDLSLVKLVVTGDGDDEAVLFTDANGLYRIHQESMVEIEVSGETGAPDAFSATQERLLVAFDNRLYDVDLVAWTQVLVTDSFGAIADISVTDELFTLSTESGMVLRAANGAYTEYQPLEGSTPMATSATLWHENHGIIGSVPSGLVEGAAEVGGLVPLDLSSGGASLAKDGYGNVWVGTGPSLVGVMVGEQVLFDPDVADVLQTHCASCHTDGISGAPKHDFGEVEVVTALADDIVGRVTSGTMPPTGALPPEDYETLIRWYTTGQNP